MELLSDGAEHSVAPALNFTELLQVFDRLPIPIVAAVHGVCVGGGLELALAADLIVAAESAKIGAVEATLGLNPLMGAIQRITERAGAARAKEMALLARRYDARTLEKWNIINRVVADEQLPEASVTLAHELANGATRARYLPTLGLQANGSYNGLELDRLVWNLSAAVNLSWLIYDGGNVRGILREGAANLAALAAQVDSIRLQIRVEVEQAQLAVSAAKAALGAADRSLSNARARLDLAEVRYRTGVGNGIELSDAQLAATNASFQKLQAQLKLDTARAQLTKALART